MRIDPPPPPPPGRRPWRALLNAVRALAQGHAEVMSHAEHPWASITFAGSRHTMALRFVGSEAVTAGERFIAALPEHEFTIPRRLVADASVIAVRHELLPEPKLTVEMELLLLEDA